MDWQEAVALTVVAATAALLLWGRFRPRRGSFSKASHCGCATPSLTAQAPIITYHARKGQRPVVIVRQPAAQPSKLSRREGGPL